MLFGLLLALSSPRSALAADEVSIEQTFSDADEMLFNASGNTLKYQSFTASSTNVSMVSLNILGVHGPNTFSVELCEISSLTSLSCTDTPQESAGRDYTDFSTTGWYDFDFSTPYPTTAGHYYLIKVKETDADATGMNIRASNYDGDKYADGRLYYEGYGWTLTNRDFAFKVYTDPAAGGTTLAITSQSFDSISQILTLSGTCAQYGSGYYQMTISSATSTGIDPLGPWRGGLVDCHASSSPNFTAIYNGSGLIGTTTIYIDDSFYHPTSSPNVASVDQNFSPATTTDWEFSVGYMSEDDPAGTAHRIACTDAEWAETDWWTEIKCNSVFTWYKIYFGLRDQVKSGIGGLINSTKIIFPFSLATRINQCWTDSATATIPSTLSWLAGDEGGDVKLTMPASWTSTTTTITLWGPGLAAGNEDVEDVFENIRGLSPYVMATLSLIGIIIFSWKVSHQKD